MLLTKINYIRSNCCNIESIVHQVVETELISTIHVCIARHSARSEATCRSKRDGMRILALKMDPNEWCQILVLFHQQVLIHKRYRKRVPRDVLMWKYIINYQAEDCKSATTNGRCLGTLFCL